MITHTGQKDSKIIENDKLIYECSLRYLRDWIDQKFLDTFLKIRRISKNKAE